MKMTRGSCTMISTQATLSSRGIYDRRQDKDSSICFVMSLYHTRFHLPTPDVNGTNLSLSRVALDGYVCCLLLPHLEKENLSSVR
mmetsp:Transcript_6655/g.15139  ORF Transcript_6655/g.15139 Transcript_6655/m.15139 type:complete len:85 (+) Transcript_6655:922-1176(+)